MLCLLTSCACVKTLFKQEGRKVDGHSFGPFRRLDAPQLTALRDKLLLDGVYNPIWAESPYIRIGFHVAASYDPSTGAGGWGDLPGRQVLRDQGLLDDVLVVYWDVMETYYDNNIMTIGMGKADFMSFLIYLFSLHGLYSQNITWRAGRNAMDSGRVWAGEVEMPEGMPRSYKPQPSVEQDGYLRSFFGRLGFHEDAEVVALMGGHMFGSARGFPYLGEWADSSVQSRDEVNAGRKATCGLEGCYFKHLLEMEWVEGCPTFCSTCMWGAGTEEKVNYNLFDPYNTTWSAAPFNYTHSSAWGNTCTERLAAQGYKTYTNRERFLLRLPTEMELVRDDALKNIVEEYAGDRGLFEKSFGRAFSKMLEVGVEDPSRLYSVVSFEAQSRLWDPTTTTP